MNPVPRQKLVELVARFGRDICEDARRCEALLRDVCGDHYKREVFALVGAVKDRAAAELHAGLNGVPKEVLLARLSKRLHSNLGLAEDLARWSVESWALSLNVVKIGEITFQFTCPACAYGPKTIPNLAGKRVKCPKCNAAVVVSDDGRRFDLCLTSKTGVHIGSSGNPPVDDDDPFAEETSVTPEDMLRQAIRRVLADGVVTEKGKAEVQSLRRTLGIAAETASRLYGEEKARLSRTAPVGRPQQKDFSDPRKAQGSPPTTVCPNCGECAMVSPDGRRGRCGSCEHVFFIGDEATADPVPTFLSPTTPPMPATAFRSGTSVRPLPARATADIVSTTGKLFITRTSKMTGCMYGVQVAVSGQVMGVVKNGGTVSLDLPAGKHTVELRGGGLSRSAVISVSAGTTLRYIMFFSNWGALGGGLNFRPE